jgi:hypothetical protein
MVENASNELSNNCCNDAPVRVKDVNREELIQFIDEYSKQFSDSHGVDEEDEEAIEWKEHLLSQIEEGKVYFTDYMILDLLVKKLLS